MMRLLRPPHSGIFLRSFRLHSAHYARETIAKICSLWVALATAIMRQAGSRDSGSHPAGGYSSFSHSLQNCSRSFVSVER
jgi:hypothetical protein